jgi:hypothetical protein
MKPIPVPERLQGRPQYHGLPIPYIALIKENGEPDFRVTDEVKRREVMMIGLCQLCGQELGKYFFFMGGPISAENNLYFEPAAHLECVLYAMQVCPFIIGKLEHAEVEKIQADNPEVMVKVDDSYTTIKQSDWVIKKARQFSFVSTPGGTILIRPQMIIYQTQLLYPPKMKPEDWEKLRKELEKK